jgi:hypothetical protein
MAMHQEQYARPVSVLQENGYDAEIEMFERRSAGPISPDILIHVEDHLALILRDDLDLRCYVTLR